jgi:hypothetical protein
MGTPLDPLGKRALFWMPVDTQVAVEPEPPEGGRTSRGSRQPVRTTGRRRARPSGHHALYSAVTPAADAETPAGVATSADPLSERGIFTVNCSACGSVSRIGLLDFTLLQLPFAMWVPGRTFDHRMRCPSCRRRAWTGVTISS